MQPKPHQLLLISPADCAFLSERLQEAGYSLQHVQDARLGLETLQAGETDLLLLDLHTAGALETLSAVRANEDLKPLPVILLGAPEDGPSIETGLQACADDFLLKPYSPTLARGMIQDYLEIGGQRRAEHNQRQREGLLKLEHDVEIARDIQLNFLPCEYPQPEGWDVAACFHPARQVAGDWYDAFYMANKRRVGFLVADVCDKGVGSALFMALFRSLIRAFAQQNLSLRWMDTSSEDWGIGDIPAKRKALPSTGTTALNNAVVITNNYMCENHLQLNYFATMFFGVLNPASGEISYINAGHPPAFVVDKKGGLRERLTGTGPAVGIFPGVEFNIGETVLEPGDMLLTYSDGVTDARHPSGERFSEKRLLSLLETPSETARDLLNRIEAELKAHIAGADQFDDITMMSVYYKPYDSKSEIER